jgi:hypothetical protein
VDPNGDNQMANQFDDIAHTATELIVAKVIRDGYEVKAGRAPMLVSDMLNLEHEISTWLEKHWCAADGRE